MQGLGFRVDLAPHLKDLRAVVVFEIVGYSEVSVHMLFWLSLVYLLSTASLPILVQILPHSIVSDVMVSVLELGQRCWQMKWWLCMRLSSKLRYMWIWLLSAPKVLSFVMQFSEHITVKLLGHLKSYLSSVVIWLC
jgi:hypothetical protein